MPEVRFKLHRPCNVQIDAAVQCWLDTLHARILDEARRAVRIAKYRRPVWSNVTPLVRWGMLLLKKSPWKVLLADKTGGYVLVRREDVPKLHEMVFSKLLYRCVSDSPELVHNHYVRYFGAVKRIASHLKDEQLGAQLRKTAYMPNSQLISKLPVTVKTHKPQGNVTVRNLHCSQWYAFKGIGLWIQKQLGRRLAQIPFILKSVREVVPRVCSVGAVLSQEHFLVKFDIRDFFVSGDLPELMKDTLKILSNEDAQTRGVFEDALWVLLSSQLVHSSETQQIAQVVHGSGMGVSQSAGIADTAFFCKAERGLCTPDVLKNSGVELYMRYRDDGLILVSDISAFKPWFAQFKVAAGYFKVEVEAVKKFYALHTEEVDFLQCTVMLCHHTRTLRAKPLFKNEGVPLDQGSAHHPAVHRWPMAQLRQLAFVASDAETAAWGKMAFIANFEKHLSNGPLLSELQSTPAWPRPESSKQRSGQKQFWLPLSWHPVWKYAQFSRVINSMYNVEMRHLVDGVFDEKFPPMKIAWKNRLMYSKNWLARL